MNKAIICGAVLMVSALAAGGPVVQASAANDAAQEAAQARRQNNGTAAVAAPTGSSANYVQSDQVFHTAALGSGQLTGDYRLAKYDVIALHVVGFPQGLGYSTGGTAGVSGTSGSDTTFSGTSTLSSDDVMIGPDGNAAIPYIGNVKLAGMTLDEATAYVQDRLGEYIRFPSMSISVKVYGARKVYVMGEVAKPGSQSMKVDELNAYAAISSAGGFTKRGRSTQVQVLRVIDGTMYYKVLNIKNFIRKHDLAQNVALQDGDIVYVPKSNGVLWSEDVLPYISAWALFRTLTN